MIRNSIRDVATAIPGAQARLVVHARKMSVAGEHNWSMTTPDLFTRSVRAWIEDQPLPVELKELK